MLLLVGDLFHENKPSRAAMYQTIALLREYSMGRKPISMQLISDAGIGLKHDFKSAHAACVRALG
jgi:double-strand break repair protein MRE11